MRSGYAFNQAASTHIISPNMQIVCVVPTAVIASSRRVEESLTQQQQYAMQPYHTLSSCFSSPSLFLSMAAVHFCPFNSLPRKVHHSHHPSEWFPGRRSPETHFNKRVSPHLQNVCDSNQITDL